MMRSLIFVAAVLAVASALPKMPFVTTDEMFTSWTIVHNKTYSVEERTARLAIWESNYKLVTAHNEAAANGEHSYTLAMNKFADLTNEEYKGLLGLRARERDAMGTYTPVKDAPASWDWRTHNPPVVNKVKDQGQCGSCWSFSAVATMEGAWALKTGKLLSLSEQELVDCVNHGADTCDQGGEMYDGVEYAVQSGGMETETAYPYTAQSTKVCKFKKSETVAQFTAYKNVTSGDEDALTSAAYTQPIVSVGIDASHFSFQLYGGGVYNEKKCKNSIDDLDHGVAVVGYGTKSGKDYYIVRNSWGEGWGLGGYILMSRGKNNQCGIATQAMFAEV